ncbi:uncharacterized protein RHOBADRAFT_52097 [Rhodotorula graminis WP1]|uniref:F-box domain-containing protein n=1 Tax=Rhodotorula graminis (strain WP1) TaxID=578459 RepID=A0A194S9K9_RHOGW|nr:uncharacterized protein RHOBADRAFT_52097 [Rhodotorula graminis WP1]KPV77150.1 hypothetical protein RHOBADRAFT_52097 [Rhodotorula graminis WP1]
MTFQLAAKAERAMRESDEDEPFHELDSSSDEDEAPDSNKGASPRASKLRSSGGGARGTKGTLCGILDLPLDVLAGICEHLDLETLFHLSRLNKRFFKFLRGNSTLSYLWEWAREESGLPELAAPCFSTVELANLLFSKYCQNCARTTPKADFLLRVRLCQACSKNLIWDDRDLDFPLDNFADTALRRFGPHAQAHRVPDPRPRLHADCKRRWIKAGVHNVIRIEKGAGFIESGKDYTFQEFKDRCFQVSILRDQDGDAIIEWQQQRVIEQDKIRQARRVQRREAIEARLVERGWQPHHPEWKAHSLVNMARDLNDKIWSSIRGKLETFLQAQEAERDAAHIAVVQERRLFEVEQEHTGLVADRQLATSLGLYPLPPWSEFGQLAVVKKLWHVETIDEAYEDDYPTIVTEASAIADELSALHAAFKSGLVNQFVGILSAFEQVPVAIQSILEPADPSGFSADEEDVIVGLACCALTCGTCSLVDVFPRILAHKCKQNWPPALVPASCSLAQYKVKEAGIAAVLSLLAAGKLDADAPCSELDALGSTFTCLCGSNISAEAVPWQNMVEHIMLYHGKGQAVWDDVVAESRQEALERVFKKHEKNLRWAGRYGGDDGA